MQPIGEWFRRVWYLINRRRVDAALEQEMEAHRAVMDQPARFGNALRLREEARDVWGWASLDSLTGDLRFAVRALRRSPGLTLVAISSLTLGFVLVSMTTTVANAYLLRALPYGGTDRLYHVRYAPPGPWEPRGMTALDWSSVSSVVEFPVTAAGETFYISEGSYAQSIRGLRVTPGFVKGLDVRAAFGRVLNDRDFENGAERAAMIGYAVWRERYGSDPQLVGRLISAEAESQHDSREIFRVVGVLPPEFYFGRDSSAVVDLLTPATAPTRTYMIQLRRGVTPGEAEHRITEAARVVSRDLPADWTGVHLESVRARYVAELRPILVGVTAAALFVLVIVCTNLAVLTLLRAMRRQKEMAVRTSLGCSRFRIARLLAFESLIICVIALTAAIAVTQTLLPALTPVIELRLGRPAPGGAGSLPIDGGVLLMLGGVGVLVAMSLAFLPLLAPAQRLADVLRRDRTGATGGRVMTRLRSVLIGFEVACTLTLLVGGGLMLRSVSSMLGTDLGFNPEHLARARIVLRSADYADPQAFFRYFDQFAERLSTTAGAPVAFSTWPPFVELPAGSAESAGPAPRTARVGVLRAGGGYFATIGTVLRSGRDFTADDARLDVPVAVVSESLATRLWPEGSPVGRQVREIESTVAGSRLGVWRTVVGVAADVRRDYFEKDAADLYVPLSPAQAGRYGSFYIRRDRADDSLLASMRTVATALDPRAVVDGFRIVSRENRQLEGAQFLTTAMTAVAIVAVFLALLGIYGAMAYAVKQREHEIAIRMALGASAGGIRLMFLRQSAFVILAGLAVGLFASVGLAKALESWLYGVPASDPATIASACALMAATGILAAWWPARRASLRSPHLAMKED